VIIGRGVKRILTIENRANYIDHVRKSKRADELILYHGGQYSPAKRVFLSAIAAVMPGCCDFYHWGDIDYGGFLMLARLRREIFANVQPWKMGVSELDDYRSYVSGFTDQYKKRLASLLDIPELSDCVNCIEYMVAEGIRLEQEALLT
jgi:hypothetical protein